MSFLYSKVYVTCLSTRVPINSEPTKASSRGPCVLSQTDENIDLLGGKESSHAYVCNAIVGVCTEELQPAGLPSLFLAWLMRAFGFKFPSWDPTPSRLNTLSRCKALLCTWIHLNLTATSRYRQNWTYRLPLIDGEAQTSSAILPRLPSQRMSGRKPRSRRIKRKSHSSEGRPRLA